MAAPEGAAAPPARVATRFRAADWWGARPLTVLLADEDPAARAEMQMFLSGRAEVVLCADGAEALWQAGRVTPSVVVLSATLPVVTAADVAGVVARHREGPVSIAVGVGFGETEQAAPVLAAGANRVMSRPYQAREVEPLLHEHLAGERRHWQGVLRVGAIELDAPAFDVWVAGQSLRLSLREFELLRLLMANAGSVVTQQYIREQLWESRGDSVNANTIAVHIRRLRSHLAGFADILVVRGVGYRLRVAAGGPGTGSAKECT